ncbi:MAG: response regulator transcription factor [Burkholderiales bacterium]|jgi:DNA-binding response OmpR family regulator|nr:response regulator transcription factor [Burkholderiales bacterium]
MNETPILTLVDDDQALCELLAGWLTQDGFTVRCCHEARSALASLRESLPSALILDVMLPDGSGLDLLRTLRESYPSLPVLMLSARGEPLDRVLGLELGADDYLAKPCDPRELTARLRALLRRRVAATGTTAEPAALTLDDVTLHPQRGMVTLRGSSAIPAANIILTLTESRVLEALLTHPDQPIDKTELFRATLGRKPTAYDRSLDVHISNLRKKLGNHPDGQARIIGLRGRGYMYVRHPNSGSGNANSADENSIRQ